MDRESYRCALLQRLEVLYARAQACPDPMPTILDVEWRGIIEREIDGGLQGGCASVALRSEKATLFFTLTDECHDALGHVARLLAAVRRVPFKKGAVDQKMKHLRGNRTSFNVYAHLFEAAVLGRAAERNVLTDVDVAFPPGNETIDGEITIGSERVLLEVAYAQKEVLPRTEGVFSGMVDRLLLQVAKKLRTKAAGGRQLARVKCEPGILVLGLNDYGADQVMARIAIDACFADPGFAGLSAVVVSDSWRFMRSVVVENPNAQRSLSPPALDELRSWST